MVRVICGFSNSPPPTAFLPSCPALPPCIPLPCRSLLSTLPCTAALLSSALPPCPAVPLSPAAGEAPKNLPKISRETPCVYWNFHFILLQRDFTALFHNRVTNTNIGRFSRNTDQPHGILPFSGSPCDQRRTHASA